MKLRGTWLTASAAWLPLAAGAQTSGSDPAVAVLLGQADYWRAHGQPEHADKALHRVRRLCPTNADALARQAQAAADSGDTPAARLALLQLEAAKPSDPRVPMLEQVLRQGALDPAGLAAARALAHGGKAAEAVSAYRRLFKGNTPPPSLAAEYYQTLAATPNGQMPAQDGLAAALRANPDDLNAQFAYAEVLTYREASRAAGIDRLAALTRYPALAQPAREAWRRLLHWSGSLAQLDVYLKQYPDDIELADRRDELVTAHSSESTGDRAADTLRDQAQHAATPEEQFRRAELASGRPQEPLSPTRYASNQPRRIADDTSPVPPAVPREPVTREYEQNTPPLRPSPALDLLINPPSVALPPGTRPVEAVRGGAIPNSSQSPSEAMPDEPYSLPTLRGEVRPQPPPDPVMAEIERGINQVSADPGPEVNASVALRGRSEPSGSSTLYDLTTALEASYSLGGFGRLRLAVTPEYLSTGSGSAANLANFGTNPLTSSSRALRDGQTSAAGVGLDLGYGHEFASADIGTTPLGFQLANVTGGIELAPSLASGLTLRATLDRRAVTDSLLSYAGEKDPRTGTSWGGITRDHGHLQLELSVNSITYYVGAGGGLLTGQNVRDNTEVDAGAGFSVPVWSTGSQELRAGLDLAYATYNRNEQNFTFGSGGYFSPQNFVSGLIPITYRQTVSPDLSFNVGGSLGVQSFTENATPVFENAGLQRALLARAAVLPGTVTTLSGTHSNGLAGGGHADIDYRALGNLHIGAKADFDRSGNFTEGTGLVYARYLFSSEK